MLNAAYLGVRRKGKLASLVLMYLNSRIAEFS